MASSAGASARAGSTSAMSGADRMPSMRLTASCASVTACDEYMILLIIMVVSAEKIT